MPPKVILCSADPCTFDPMVGLLEGRNDFMGSSSALQCMRVASHGAAGFIWVCALQLCYLDICVFALCSACRVHSREICGA